MRHWIKGILCGILSLSIFCFVHIESSVYAETIIPLKKGKTESVSTRVKPSAHKGKTGKKIQKDAKIEPLRHVGPQEKNVEKIKKDVVIKNKEDVHDMNQWIRVHIGSFSDSIMISSQEDMHLVEKPSMTLHKNEKYKIWVKGGSLYLGNDSLENHITIDTQNEKQGIQVGNRVYRGRISLTLLADKKIRVINQLPLELYLYGVLPEEVIPSWPMPALEAQAVAARTYAWHAMLAKQKGSYDVEADTRSQVYNGMLREHARTNAAVDATKGVIMTYQNRPIDAVFHADAGGYTEDSELVWNEALPYLRGVKEVVQKPWEARTSYEWKLTTTKADMEEALRKAGKNIGQLQAIELSPLSNAQKKEVDRTMSGRVQRVVFVGTQGDVTLSGAEVSKIWGLKSTLFGIKIEGNGKNTSSVDTSILFDKKRALRKKGNTDKKTKTSVKEHTDSFRQNFSRGNDVVIIEGRGFGHGIGLSQWGAAQMAMEYKGNDPKYYETILHHYYTGITISKI